MEFKDVKVGMMVTTAYGKRVQVAGIYEASHMIQVTDEASATFWSAVHLESCRGWQLYNPNRWARVGDVVCNGKCHVRCGVHMPDDIDPTPVSDYLVKSGWQGMGLHYWSGCPDPLCVVNEPHDQEGCKAAPPVSIKVTNVSSTDPDAVAKAMSQEFPPLKYEPVHSPDLNDAGVLARALFRVKMHREILHKAELGDYPRRNKIPTDGRKQYDRVEAVMWERETAVREACEDEAREIIRAKS